ncbi:metallophosphoesterase family protein [Candidatus Stoquefichus sp. SB1]|uniref:metallophosphoesterase family protein n=1 Tax=Candidatus Stoquefichus sp. SB1 TaxID=1658109 RepID=UPI00067F5422|nr:metallophosphoesterase [Candidatus Stoquefichus sp. SB1]
MGQILIISDSHYMPKNKLLKFINQFDSLKAVIHCGDIYIGYQPGDLSINCPLYMCKGNNDFADIPRILHFEIDGKRFVITHGNMYQYAYNPLALKELLEDYPADIICFGHTHIPFLYKENDLMIINPGSLSLGRSYPRHNTYALYDTLTDEVHFFDIQDNQEVFIQIKRD